MQVVADRHRWVGLALLLCLSAGCSKEEPDLVSVRGKVFYRDQPLTAGMIVFTPDQDRGGRGPLARADIGPDGSYTLTTGSDAGAVPGWHRITVLTPRSSLPRKYSDPAQSGLEREVKAGRENVIDLRLD